MRQLVTMGSTDAQNLILKNLRLCKADAATGGSCTFIWELTWVLGRTWDPGELSWVSGRLLDPESRGGNNWRMRIRRRTYLSIWKNLRPRRADAATMWRICIYLGTYLSIWKNLRPWRAVAATMWGMRICLGTYLSIWKNLRPRRADAATMWRRRTY